MGEPPAFIFGVDLDGVCGDYTAAFRTVVSSELGIPPEKLPLERSWDFREWGIDADDFSRLHRLAVIEHRILRDLPMIENCADVLWRLSDAGVWIRVITHRLYVNWSHAIAVSDTVEWLDATRIPYRDICFLGDKPQVEADLYVDDGEHNIEALRGSGNEVITFDQPYNRDVPGLRAHSWLEVESIVAQRLSDRDDGYQEQLPGVDAGASRLSERLGD